MRRLKPQTRKAISQREDDLVKLAENIAKRLWEALNDVQRRDGKVRQLRNILEVAESTDSWKALELFIRYQAARGELPKDWAESAIQAFDALQTDAQRIAKDKGDPAKTIHLELVTRVLGHAVRWHVWEVKKQQEG